MHVAKAYALRGIEAAEDSSATKLGCSNLRDKQKEAIVSFISGKDVLVQLPTGNGKSLCCVRISHSCDTTRSMKSTRPFPLGGVWRETSVYVCIVCTDMGVYKHLEK